MTYQRDLFSPQMDIMDQLIYQKSQPWNTTGKPKEEPQPGSLAYMIARQRRRKQLQDRLRALRLNLFRAEDRGKGHHNERLTRRTEAEVWLLDHPVKGKVYEDHYTLILYRQANPLANKAERSLTFTAFFREADLDGKVYSDEFHRSALEIMDLK